MKTGSAFDFALDFNLAAVLLHDAVDNRKAQPRPIILGRKERIENVRHILRFNPGAIVLHGDAQNLVDVFGESSGPGRG